MADFINKIISLVLIFILLVLAPILNQYLASEATTERLVLNDVEQFIDKVTDKKVITAADVDELYMDVNSNGGFYNVSVDKYIRVASFFNVTPIENNYL